MKTKLKYLTKLSLSRKIKTKWFLIANIVILLGVIALSNIDNIITYFGGDFNDGNVIYILDNTQTTYDTLVDQISTQANAIYGEDALYEYNKIDNMEGIEDILNEDSKNILLVINTDELSIISVDIETKEYMDTVDYQLYYSAISNTKSLLTINHLDLSETELEKLYSMPIINRIILDEDSKSTEEQTEMIMTTMFPIVILPFFMLVIFLVQMIGTEVNEEKTTKSMEIIISNVSPKIHLFSKVLAGNLFIIIQGLLLLFYTGLGLLIRIITTKGALIPNMGIDLNSVVTQAMNTGLATKLMYIIPLTLGLMLLTFLAYSLLAGVLASMTTNAEDFSQLQTPIMMISLAGYYLAIMAGLFDGALFIRVLSYVPLISAILSPSLLVLGDIGIVDVIISIVIMIGFIMLLIKYGLKIYKAGILNYSSKGLWKKMFKAIKE